MSLNKIYSRPRIRFPRKNFKPKSKKQKIKLFILLILMIIIILIIIIAKATIPVFISSCETEAASVAVNVLNNEVNEAMTAYNYDDLVNVVKNDDGSISYIEAKIVPINQLVSQIISNVQEELDALDTIVVDINLGSVSGISSLSLISPKFSVRLESSGKVETSINSEFESVGINQTIHRIYLNLKCKVGILTPFQTVSKTVENEVLLTETVIVGDVPETYYFYDNLGFEDILDTD